jgi:hypothetical protein
MLNINPCTMGTVVPEVNVVDLPPMLARAFAAMPTAQLVIHLSSVQQAMGVQCPMARALRQAIDVRMETTHDAP